MKGCSPPLQNYPPSESCGARCTPKPHHCPPLPFQTLPLKESPVRACTKELSRQVWESCTEAATLGGFRRCCWERPDWQCQLPNIPQGYSFVLLTSAARLSLWGPPRRWRDLDPGAPFGQAHLESYAVSHPALPAAKTQRTEDPGSIQSGRRHSPRPFSVHLSVPCQCPGRGSPLGGDF